MDDIYGAKIRREHPMGNKENFPSYMECSQRIRKTK